MSLLRSLPYIRNKSVFTKYISCYLHIVSEHRKITLYQCIHQLGHSHILKSAHFNRYLKYKNMYVRAMYRRLWGSLQNSLAVLYIIRLCCRRLHIRLHIVDRSIVLAINSGTQKKARNLRKTV